MAKQAEKQADAAEPVEDGTPQLDSKYRLIIVAAQRSKQLQRGARPRVEGMDTQRHKPTRLALEADLGVRAPVRRRVPLRRAPHPLPILAQIREQEWHQPGALGLQQV